LLSSWHHSFTTIQDQARGVQDAYKIPVIIVTRGGEGAFLNMEGKEYEHHGYQVTVADTIGSGDAFLAGFLFKLNAGAKGFENLEFANAVGAFVASRQGACPDYKPDQVAALIKSSPIRKK
jgi:fructokinase